MAAKKRSSNWSEEEKSTALELISSKGQKLFGSFRGASLGAKEKKELWESITQQLNASGVCCPYRTLEEVKIMYKNSKAAVKGKIDLTRKTGGGGMICLSQSEEVMANHLEIFNARQLNGVPGGFECGAAAKDEHGVVEESGWSSLLENMDTDIIRNVIDYHPSEADICKANAPLEDAVGACDVPSTSGFVPSTGKMSRRKRKSDAGDQLFQLEEKRLTAETAAFSAQEHYWREKNRREEELHLVTLNLRKHQLKEFQ